MTLLEDVRALLATAMPDYETFRSREGVIIIAVERHNHNSEQYTSQGPSARFVWIKGRMVSCVQYTQNDVKLMESCLISENYREPASWSIHQSVSARRA